MLRLIDVVGTRRRVWLTSFWGFEPRTWGCVGFTNHGDYLRFLRNFIESAEPAGLVAIYVTTTAPKKNKWLRGKLAGFMEMGQKVGESFDFIDLKEEAQILPQLQDGRWLHSVQAVRAWRLITPLQIAVAAPDSYTPGRAQYIGRQGVEMSAKEVDALHQLAVEPAEIFKGGG